MNTVNAARVELGVGDDTNHMTLKEPPANTEWHIFLFLPYLNRMLNRNSWLDLGGNPNVYTSPKLHLQ